MVKETGVPGENHHPAEVTEEMKIMYPINYFDYRKIMRLVHIIYFRFHIANLENDEFSTTM